MPTIATLVHALLIATMTSGLLLFGAASPAWAAEAIPADGQGLADDVASSFPLEATTWRLTEYLRRGDPRATGPEVAAWLSLSAGRLSGSSGCNKLAGTYATVGERIAFKPRVRRRDTCAEQTMMVEQGLRDGLRQAASYRIAPAGASWPSSRLVISDSEGVELLRFSLADATPLTSIEWRLTAYGSAQGLVPADRQQPAILRFEPTREDPLSGSSEGELVGSSGCNGLVGRYFRHASVLSFGPLEVTDAPCAADLTAQEEAVLAVLEATSVHLELPPDRLVLTSSDDGAVLEFSNASPLEASTWLLAKPSSPGTTANEVTFRLMDGRVEGEGPCGPYTGAYATNGVMLTFSDLKGADAPDCPDARAERRLLDALRRTVISERSATQLRLRDAFGKIVARFERPGGP